MQPANPTHTPLTPIMRVGDANAKQPGGTHYQAAYQHWDFIAETGLGYFEAQVTKYICRHRKKNGLLDVQKAEHFLEKMIELRMGPHDHFRPPTRAFPAFMTAKFINAQEPPLEELEAEVIRIASHWERTSHLQEALARVRKLKEQYAAADAAQPTRAYNAQSLDRPVPGQEAA